MLTVCEALQEIKAVDIIIYDADGDLTFSGNRAAIGADLLDREAIAVDVYEDETYITII